MKQVALALVFVFALAACGGENTGSLPTHHTPTETATSTPTPTPTPEPASPAIEDGTWFVGSEVQPGTYIAFVAAQDSDFVNCYWETSTNGEHGGVPGASGVGDIISNDNQPYQAIVTIKKNVYAFYSSGCNGWWPIEQYQFLFGSGQSQDYVTALGYVPGDGQFLVGYDIEPGTYRSDGTTDSCYWARLSGFSGDIDDIITNDFSMGGRRTVVVRASDVGFETSGCGSWSKIE
jgi:hypothetical protein